MSECRLTPDQEAAVTIGDCALLVSAAAGSGKTKVLVERLMRRVAEGADIDSFLIITYTRAAAAELKSRILTELGRLTAADPENRRLRRQAGLCSRAPIGTIHSFCTALLRENAHLLGLAPDFRVADEDRAKTTKAAVLDRLLDSLYRDLEKQPGLRELVDTVGAGRDDSRLSALVLEVHTVLQSHPYPKKWAQEQLSALSLGDTADAGETPWGCYILRTAAETAAFWGGRLSMLLDVLTQPEHEALAAAYGGSLAETTAGIGRFVAAAETGWDVARAALPVPFPRLRPFRGEDALADSVKAAREACKKASSGVAAKLAGDSARLLTELHRVRPAMEALLDLCFRLDAAFAAEKRRQGFLDFPDLEHLALRLLEKDAGGDPTPLALSVSRRYTEIMVDEYQDASEIQDRLFRAVSREGRNLFLVGDVKQSIYRFRLAEPGLFIDKLLRYGDADAPAGEPRRVLLRENFRSRGCVIDAVNHVFENLMSPRMGEIRYDDGARLRQGADYPAEGDTPAEFSILELPGSSDADEECPNKTELEAAMVARRIRELLDSGTLVSDSGALRPLSCGDIVILLRAPGGAGDVYRRALLREGLPAVSRQGGGFFQSLEVAVLLSLLGIIDNPRQDVPLISVLRSPLFGFSADELSAIRAADRKSDFYSALIKASESNARCADFLRALSAWRALAPDLSVEALTGRVCAETDLFALCAAMPDGTARRENVQRLLDLARQYEADGYRGLFGFSAWLRRLAERGEEPQTGTDLAGAVRIMSIHKSKGLEFPVVFLADTGRQFNRNDQRRTVLLHPVLGLGPKVTDPERGIEYPGLARRAIALRIDRENLSEELRTLYVAMTRARERLYISCAWKEPEKRLAKLREGLTSPVAPELLETDRSPSHWLARAALLPGPIALRICRPGGESPAPEAVLEKAAENKAAAAPSRDSANAEREPLPADGAAAIRERLDWVYPHKAAEILPSKVTATSLKGLTPPDGEAAPLAKPLPHRAARYPDLGRAENALTGAARGVATHLVLQLMDLSKAGSAGEIAEETARLQSLGHLTEKQAAAVDIGAVLRFFASDIGQRMLHADTLRREFRFSLLFPAARWFEGASSDEEVLLQGVADCCIEESGELTVIDYKTDYVPPGGPSLLAARYAPQLQTYAAALRRILKMPVRECVLYFLRTGDAVSVPPE